MKSLNENILRISSAGIYLPREVKLGFSYKIETEIDITANKKIDNQDGTYNQVFTGRSNGEIKISGEKQVINSTSKISNSKKLRGAIYHYWNDKGYTNIDFETFYDDISKGLTGNIEMVLDNLINFDSFLDKYKKNG